MGSHESNVWGGAGEVDGKGHALTRDRAPQDADDARRVLDALRRIVRGLRLTAHAAERAHGLSGAQLFVVQQLKSGPASSMAELAKRTLTDPSSVSVVVRRLRERGLVACTPAADDARRIRISLTRRGEAVSRAAPETMQASLVAAVESMPATTRRSLARGLTELVHVLGMEGEARLFFEDEHSANGPVRAPLRRGATRTTARSPRSRRTS